ncbi:MAG: FTR1 family protein [Alphaproteobacteria bacterium]|nr:FTR1 family protein [Alphaproteobacteria bacterium]
MLATLIIVFREMIEAGLIIGIVMSATRGVARRGAWVSYGVVAGLFGACLVAAFAGAISAAMEGIGQELFNVGILGLAVAMLTWHNVWMARHGRELAAHVKDVGSAVAAGGRSLAALAVVVGIAVLREGSEVVLFLYGILISGQQPVASVALGGVLGVLLGGALGVLMYLGLLRVPMRRLFAVTGALIALLAAGMAAQAAALLEQAQIITALSDVVWNSSAFIESSSVLGKTLHTLVGYTDRPTGMQLAVYVTTLLVIFTLMRLFGHTPRPAATAIPLRG